MGTIFLIGLAFLLLSWAAGLNIRINEPPLLFLLGLLFPVVLLWGGLEATRRAPHVASVRHAGLPRSTIPLGSAAIAVGCAAS
jgi:hypothetical protein